MSVTAPEQGLRRTAVVAGDAPGAIVVDRPVEEPVEAWPCRAGQRGVDAQVVPCNWRHPPREGRGRLGSGNTPATPITRCQLRRFRDHLDDL